MVHKRVPDHLRLVTSTKLINLLQGFPFEYRRPEVIKNPFCGDIGGDKTSPIPQQDNLTIPVLQGRLLHYRLGLTKTKTAFSSPEMKLI